MHHALQMEMDDRKQIARKKNTLQEQCMIIAGYWGLDGFKPGQNLHHSYRVKTYVKNGK